MPRSTAASAFDVPRLPPLALAVPGYLPTPVPAPPATGSSPMVPPASQVTRQLLVAPHCTAMRETALPAMEWSAMVPLAWRATAPLLAATEHTVAVPPGCGATAPALARTWGCWDRAAISES